MSLIDRVLRPPSYGWSDEQGLPVKPSTGQLLREFAHRTNIVSSRKNWLALTSWLQAMALLPFLVVFLTKYFTWPLAIGAFVYSMIGMGSHGTIWYHRYSTHGAFKFKSKFWRLLTQNLVIKAVSEELYVVSHLVHHHKSDKPGDPYLSANGFLYCFLADAVHQPIALDLDERAYSKTTAWLKRSGIPLNTYAQYQKWGSITNPYWTYLHWALNWGFWYGVFYLLGGHALATALFGGAFVWAIGVRTFNWGGHGSGSDRRVEGVDFSTDDLSINQYWPGFVAGEWHSNHHLYPSSARSGFLPHQLDLPWLYIQGLRRLGGVTEYNDAKESFLKRYYRPWLASKDATPRTGTE